MSDKGLFYDRFQPKYKYDEKLDRLVECGKVDMQELADSSKDCALSEILNKFSADELNQYMSQQASLFQDDELVDSSDMFDAIDELNVVSNHLYEIKVKYGLPGDDLDSIVKAINERKAQLADRIKNYKEKNDESKKIVEESKQEKLPSSSQGSQEEPIKA